jgi:hypothetical protein
MARRPPAFTDLLVRHLRDDVNAYGYDLDYCNQQLLEEETLTPQEARTLRLRILDLNHQVRQSQHKIEVLTFLSSADRPAPSPETVIDSLNAIGQPAAPHRGLVFGVGAPQTPSLSLLHQATQSSAAAPTPPPSSAKRPAHAGSVPVAKRAKTEAAFPEGTPENGDVGSLVQRLGYWKCRLCTSQKYLAAPQPKQPIAPCKWPLKDVAKMITHFTDMHSEHEPHERCEELGDALDSNREFWTTFLPRPLFRNCCFVTY